MKKLRVGLLMGGLSGEGYLSLRSARRIFDHYDRDRYDFIALEWKNSGGWVEYKPNSWTEKAAVHTGLFSFLSGISVDLFFVAMHGDKEGDGRLAGMFDLLNLPYTGNRFYTSFVGMNKFISKLIFRDLGLHTPRHVLIAKDAMESLHEIVRQIENVLGYPCVIKPACSGSSIGIRMADSSDTLESILPELLSQHQDLLVEEFVGGREFSVGIYGKYGEEDMKVLPIAEILYPESIFDETVKYDDRYEVVSPADIAPEAAREFVDAAMKIHRHMRFTGFSRTDVRFNGDRPYVLEVNTHTGLGGHSIFPAMLAAAGISFSRIIDDLIQRCLDLYGISRS